MGATNRQARAEPLSNQVLMLTASAICKTESRWDLIVYLGAGDRLNRDRWGVDKARQLVLVEGDPHAAARLRRATRGDSKFVLVEEVVGPVQGLQPWYRHNVPGIDGLVRQDLGPSRRLYRRLHCTGEHDVPTVSIESLLTRTLDRHGGRRHMLVVDMPLSGTAWLSVAAAALVAHFQRVEITSSAWPTSAYPAPPALAPVLSEAGFLPVEQKRASGWALEIDPAAWQIRSERKRIAASLLDLQASVDLLRLARQDDTAELAAAHRRVRMLEEEAQQLRKAAADTEQVLLESRRALYNAEGALRALDPLLRPDDDLDR